MKVNRMMIKIAILCVAIADNGMGATTPALGSIMAGMPDVAPVLVQMIATVPALMLAIIPPFYAKATQFMRKRSLLYIAAVLYIVGGVGPALLHSSIYLILFFRFLLGIASGIVMPMAVDLVVDFFEGQERNTMLGWVPAIVSMSGIVFQTLGGTLAGIRWDYCFYSYLIAIVFFLVPIIFLPEPDKKARLAAEAAVAAAESQEGKTRIPSAVWLYTLAFAFFFLFFYTVISNAAMVLASEQIATPQQIGIAFNFMTLSSFIMGALFGQMLKVLKFALYPLAFLASAIGLFITYSAHTFIPFTIGMFVIGLGLGICVPITMTKLTTLVPYSGATNVVSIAFLGMGVGGFICPFVFSLFTEPGRLPLLIGAIGMIVFGVFVLALNKANPTDIPSTGPSAAH